MKIENLVIGLQILQNLDPNAECYTLHEDGLVFPYRPEDTSERTRKRLIELGWWDNGTFWYCLNPIGGSNFV